MALPFFEQQHIAQRYAVALYDLAKEAKNIDNTAKELSELSGLFDSADDFVQFCKSPLVNAKLKKEAMHAITRKAGLSETVAAFCAKLAENNRLELLPVIDTKFQALLSQERGEVEVEITAARDLSDKDKQSLESALEKTLKQPVSPSITIDESLIGGVKIRVGSRELDASVKGTLARAAERLYDSIQQT